MSKPTIWGKHPELPLYVSIDGDIRISVATKYKRPWDKLSQSYNAANCYKRITYTKPGEKQIFKQVHVLMMETFVGQKPYGCEVGHINEIKDDNKLENLRYLDYAENRRRSCPQGEKTHNTTISNETAQAIWDRVQDFRLKCPGFVYSDGYLGTISKEFNVKKNIVLNIALNRTWKGVNRE